MNLKYYKVGNRAIATIGAVSGVEITEEEYAAEVATVSARQEVQAKVWETSRPFTAEEVNRMVIAQQINALPVDDKTALRMVEFYPEWAVDTAYTVGYKVQYGGKLWRVVQAHTAQEGWQPGNAAALWEQINETHTGELADPIPYDGNMTLENGKHYMQDWVIYLCVRDTINPVYNPLKELVGVYVEVV